ncbi:MAG: hypothetical protein ACRCYV_08775 [Aeromonas sp.]
MSAAVIQLTLQTVNTLPVGNSVAENRRNGFVLLYKSLRDAPFYREPMRKALWLHLLICCAHERMQDTFNGNRILLQRGQLVGSARSLGEACGVSEDSARRSLDYFEREGMISRTTKQGVKGFTMITVLNYSDYQCGVSEHDCAEFAAEFKAAPDKALAGGAECVAAELPAEQHAEALNNKTNKQIKNKDLNTTSQLEKTSRSGEVENSAPLADLPTAPPPFASSEPAGQEPVWEEVTELEQSALATPSLPVTRDALPEAPSTSKTTPSADDVKTAEWMSQRIKRLVPSSRQPNLRMWANCIRLMRQQDKLELSDICALFNWANRDDFWATNILSPQKLRKHWDTLSAKAMQIKPLDNNTFSLERDIDHQAMADAVNNGNEWGF